MVDISASKSPPARTPSRRRIELFQLTPFWTAFWLIFIIAAAVRLLSFAKGLPYVINPDEPNIYTTVQGWRGLFQGPMLSGYPPLVLGISFVVQVISEAFGHPGLASTIYVMRLLAVGYSLTTLILIALLARRIAGNSAALIAVALWAVSNAIVQESVAALADPIGYMLVALTLYLALVAAQDRKARYWCIYSFFVGLLATLAKYPLFPVLLPAGFIALYVLLKEDRKRGVIYLGIQVVATLAVGLWLYFGYNVMQVFVQTTFAAGGLKKGVSWATVTRLISNIDLALKPIGGPIVIVVFILGVGAYIYCRRTRKPVIQTVPLMLITGTIVTYLIVASLYTVDKVRPHDIYPVVSLLCVLFGAAIWQINSTLEVLPSRVAKIGRWIPSLLVLIFVLSPQFIATTDYVRLSRYEDRHVLVRQWAQATLEPGWVIVNGDHQRTFNSIFSGLPGNKFFPWFKTNTIEEKSPAAWRAQSMMYAALEEWRVYDLKATEAGRHYFDDMLLLRTFKARPDEGGLDTLFYRLWRPQVETTFSLSNAPAVPATQINLVGYDLTDAAGIAINNAAVVPNDEIHLTFYWNAATKPLINYSVFVHLSAISERNVLAQSDGEPATSERPTTTWDDPGETLIGRTFTLKLPPDLKPGQYRVIVGLYDSATGQRLVTSDGKQEVELITLTVS